MGRRVNGGSEDVVVGVAELDRRLRRAVESASGSYWVEGEVGSLKRAVSGHSYFTLKDGEEDACIECVMYRFDALRAQRYLSEGAKIQLFGKATVWAPRGRLQFVGQRVRPAGRGGLLLALEELKNKLAAEGLFDAARKRPLPTDPRVVGVVTSAAGAAFHDIRTVAFRRGGVRLVLSPALVQGEGAPESLLAALARLERYPGLDVVIIGRGGGSGEDLMAFNDESVVRRIANLRVPVVSAVGHEVDISLSDLVADARAATPSEAAELVVPDAEARRATLNRCSLALERSMRSRLFGLRAEIDRRRARLGDPRLVVAERQRDLDEFSARLFRRTERALKRRAQTTATLHSRLFSNHPRSVIEKQRARLLPLGARLFGAFRLGLGAGREQLSAQAARLHALSPLSVLGRGYAIALSGEGKVVRRASEAEVGDALSVRLGEGALDVEVVRVRVRDSAKEDDS